MNSQSFADFLNENKYGAPVVQQAAILYINEKTGYKPTDEMRSDIVTLVGDKQAVDAAISELKTDHKAVEQVLLQYLVVEWDSDENRDTIQRAFAAAQLKLPVVEVLIVSSIVLYAMYLEAHRDHVEKTGGVKKTHTINRKPDGTVEETITTQPVDPPATPHSALGSLFSAIKKAISLS